MKKALAKFLIQPFQMALAQYPLMLDWPKALRNIVKSEIRLKPDPDFNYLQLKLEAIERDKNDDAILFACHFLNDHHLGRRFFAAVGFAYDRFFYRYCIVVNEPCVEKTGEQGT